jgi:hypothetical protein
VENRSLTNSQGGSVKEDVEKAEPAGLSDLLISDQLVVDVASKKLFVFVNRQKESGLRKLVVDAASKKLLVSANQRRKNGSQKNIDHSAAYRQVFFGDRKTSPGEAMLILWHYYGLETSHYISENGTFTLLVGQGRPRLN